MRMFETILPEFDHEMADTRVNPRALASQPDCPQLRGLQPTPAEAMGAAVLAVIVMRERRVADAFERAGATSPDRAIAADALNLAEPRALFPRLPLRLISPAQPSTIP